MIEDNKVPQNYANLTPSDGEYNAKFQIWNGSLIELDGKFNFRNATFTGQEFKFKGLQHSNQAYSLFQYET